MVMAGSKSDAGAVGNPIFEDWLSASESDSMAQPVGGESQHPPDHSSEGYVPPKVIPESQPTVMHGSKMPIAFNNSDFGSRWRAEPALPPAVSSQPPQTTPAHQPSAAGVGPSRYGLAPTQRNTVSPVQPSTQP